MDVFIYRAGTYDVWNSAQYDVLRIVIVDVMGKRWSRNGDNVMTKARIVPSVIVFACSGVLRNRWDMTTSTCH